MKTPLLAALALIASVSAAFAQPQPPKDCTATMGPLPTEPITGQASVIDGDTIAILGLRPHVRLWGVQAPELRDKQTGRETLPGIRARAALADLIDRNDRLQVSCRATKYDRYCRLVAFCIAEEDVGAALIAQGFAYAAWLDDAAPGQPEIGARYARLETKARKERRGFWQEWLQR